MEPAVCVPASVVTLPPEIRRIWLFPASATYTVLPLTATPAALENLAVLVADPLANPGDTPATVDTVPPVANACSDPIASETPSETATTFPTCCQRRPTKRLRSTKRLNVACKRIAVQPTRRVVRGCSQNQSGLTGLTGLTGLVQTVHVAPIKGVQEAAIHR